MVASIRTSSLAVRTIVDVALAAHLVTAAAYWWFCPKWFPLAHPRFWMNSVLPLVAVAGFVGLIVMHRRRRDLAALAVICLSFLWAAATILGSVLFPISLRGFWGIGVAALLVGLFFSALLVRQAVLRPRVWLPCMALSAACGAFAMWAQLPPAATTQPIGETPPELAAGWQTAADASVFLGSGAQFNTRFAQLQVTCGHVTIFCRPLLEFNLISPDGFWSLLAPPLRTRDGQLWGEQDPKVTAHSLEANVHRIRYADDSVVVLPVPASPQKLEMTSYACLEADTFSHLNAFCNLTLSGHKSLSLCFSPTGNTQIDVLPYDYPTGRAARFAYFDESGTFYVVEGASGEKGPFHVLASGPLRRGEPLTITLHDAGQPVAAITFDDWSQQVSTQLSPTAGWRVPVNAIEFQRLGDKPTAPASIWLTLAGTSVGRGWDTVGHRAGVYRNRMRFEFEQ